MSVPFSLGGVAGHYFDRQGGPCSATEWARLYAAEGRIIAQTERDGVLVSTVWLGIDHGFGSPVPLIFETMTFANRPDSWAEDGCWRYATEREALAGHAEICSVVFSSRGIRHEGAE